MKTAAACQTKLTRLPGLICKQHYFEVPLDYERSSGKKITVFARELVAPQNESNQDLPMLVFLQGGPGFESPRPESADGWMKRALPNCRILLLDQRGTGLSTAVTHETLELIPDAASRADYLRNFRADNIVRDCEFIRKAINDDKPWTILGQSYGGFCAVSYLSLAPEGLAGALIFGGLPPLHDQPDGVYRACYKQVIAKNKIFYERFPHDAEIVSKIVKHLSTEEVLLPTGERLTASRFLQIGLNLGFKAAGRSLTSIHYLLERAFVPSTAQPRLSYAFLRAVDNFLSFNTNPIYALLHESIYCQRQPSNWSAHRILSEFSEFNLENDPIFFTGEMIYPWMFDEYQCLKPLKETARILAEYSDWPELYDVNVLRRNDVPCAATVYFDDMYVDRELSLETAHQISGLKLWITNEYEHDGIRLDGANLLDRMLAMMTGQN